jgi:hypothetical protein
VFVSAEFYFYFSARLNIRRLCQLEILVGLHRFLICALPM